MRGQSRHDRHPVTPRRMRWVFAMFAAVVIASVAIALAGLTWHLAGYTGEPPVTSPVMHTTSAAAVADPAAVIALAPFGTALSANPGANDQTVRLKGILLATPASASTVLLAGADGKVAGYGIGAHVGGGVVAAIEPDQVILRMPGGLQAIGFETNPAGVPVGMQASPPAPGANAASAGGPAAGPAAGTGGYRIDRSAPPALLAAGLRIGDLVRQVDGTPVGNGQNPQDLIAHAAHAGSAMVIVVRNGQQVSLNLAMH